MKPESVGMCSQRLARIDRFLARHYVDSGRLPCALLQVVAQRAAGAPIGTGQSLAGSRHAAD